MDVEAVVERVRQVAETRADTSAGRGDLEAAMRSIGQLRAWLAGSHAAITSRLADQVSFPEQSIAECTRGTTRDAIKDKERADLLGLRQDSRMHSTMRESPRGMSTRSPRRPKGSKVINARN